MRWGIAATGAIAGDFVTDLKLLPEASVVAVASRSRDSAEAFADRFDIRGRHASYEDLAADPNVDIVYVASPQHRHAPETLRFLAAGKHVLCEKPLAVNAAEANEMVASAKRNGLFLMEAMWSRFLPAYTQLRRILDAGRIGTPLMLESNFGFRMPVDPTHRLFDLKLGGGALLDLGVYPLALASLVFGPPDSVKGVGHLGETGVDERVAAVLHHPGGGLAVVQAAISANLSCEARITGTDGWIGLPAFMHCPDHLTLATAGGQERIAAPIEGNGLRFQAAEVERCLREGLTESPGMPLSESCSVMATMDEIRRQIGLKYSADR